MVEQNDSLLREVEEELRRERLERLWDKYGTIILAIAGFIVVGVGGYKYWQYSSQQAAQQNGVRFEEAMRFVADGKDADAEKALKSIASDGSAGYALLAQVQLAGLLVKEGKKDEAIKAFESIAANSSADNLYRDYARLQAATLMLGKADWTEMQNRLNGLTGEKNPWRHHAKELLGFAALQAGKATDARQYFVQLAVPGVPSGIRQRADNMLTMLSGTGAAPEAGKNETVDKPKADSAKK